ncbi:MAG: hypothetical protein LBI12_05730 [Treponema sp.]|jgi:hypothetical protein|nr:hypothetical protein [Treponema sp.]
MSVVRGVLIISLISIFVSAGLFLFGSIAGNRNFSGGYAVLATDVSVEDKMILGLLETGIKNSGGIVSESTQWVTFDNFGSVETIPLDEYSARIFSFDPRNDGYAEKLRNVFIQGDKRFFYIPLGAGNWNTDVLDKQFKNLLGDISFSAEYYGVGKPVFLFFTVYAFASFVFLFFCYLKRKTFRGTAILFSLLPVFSSLAFFAAGGIASAALLVGFFFLIREPFYELVITDSFFSKGNAKNILYLPLLIAFTAALGIIVVLFKINILFILAVFVSAFFVLYFSSKIISNIHRRHKRFNPVSIIKKYKPEFAFSVFMLPFAAAAVFTVFFSPLRQASFFSEKKFNAIINEQEYYAHLINQITFSTRQLGTSLNDFPEYIYDKDGLPVPNPDKNQANDSIVMLSEFPSFPLKKMMDFFNELNNGGKTGNYVSTGGIRENLTLFILLLFIIPYFIIKRKKNNMQNINIYGMKNVSGKHRFFSINRNISHIITSKNNARIRKDA